MERAITVSCNAYFAQLGVFSVGAKALSETAQLLDIPAGSVADIQAALPFAAYGQGPVLMSPFKMARVAATIAADGVMPEGRWIIDSSNSRTDAPRPILAPELAGFLAGAMRSVVLAGTARRAMQGETVSVAGKTGTAQLDEGLPHSWFAGFAPYDGDRSHSIAFAVVVEHGGYGATLAAPIAREIVDAAGELGLVGGQLMRLADLIERLGKSVFEAPFGATADVLGDSPEIAEIRIAVLDEIKKRIQRAGGKSLFPYNVVRIVIRAAQPDVAVFERDFLPKVLRGRDPQGLGKGGLPVPCRPAGRDSRRP